MPRRDRVRAADRWAARVAVAVVLLIAITLALSAIPSAPRPVEGPPQTVGATP